VANGAEYIFGNPGTTESPLTDNLHAHPPLSYVVSLHEGVSIGAASYYAQASGRAGIVNLHVAPGLGNAIGMLYGALKANSPMVVTAGQQDTRMRLRAPLLGHDLVAMAAPVVKWSVQAERADECADIMRRAFKIAHDPPAGPVFVALPIDVMEAETSIAAMSPAMMPSRTLYRAPRPDCEALAELGHHLLTAKAPAIIIGDDVARNRAGGAVTALAEALGAPIWDEVIHNQQAVPNAHPNYRGFLPGVGVAIAEALGEADAVLMIGGPFFEEVWYSDRMPFPTNCILLQIEESAARLATNYPLAIGIVAGLAPALAALVDAVKAGQTTTARKAARARNQAFATLRDKSGAARAASLKDAQGRRPMPVPLVIDVLARALPENAVIVEEAITGSPILTGTFDFFGPGDYFCGRGGGIGQGIAGALGVKLALPERPLICISGDGSAMYSITALWTAAHQKLPITFIILANREYRILKHNIDIYRARFAIDSNRDYAHLDLLEPKLGFVEIAAGMGVKGVQVSEPKELAAAVTYAVASGEARVIEVAVEGKR